MFSSPTPENNPQTAGRVRDKSQLDGEAVGWPHQKG